MALTLGDVGRGPHNSSAHATPTVSYRRAVYVLRYIRGFDFVASGRFDIRARPPVRSRSTFCFSFFFFVFGHVRGSRACLALARRRRGGIYIYQGSGFRHCLTFVLLTLATHRDGAEFIYQGSVSLLNICSTYFAHRAPPGSRETRATRPRRPPSRDRGPAADRPTPIICSHSHNHIR